MDNDPAFTLSTDSLALHGTLFQAHGLSPEQSSSQGHWIIGGSTSKDMDQAKARGIALHNLDDQRQISPQKKDDIQPDWFYGILLLCLFLIAWVRFNYPKSLGKLFSAASNRGKLNQMVREGNVMNEYLTVILYFCSQLLTSLFILKAVIMFFPGMIRTEEELMYFLIIFLISTLFSLAKVLLINTVAWMFQTGEVSKLYISQTMIINICFSILLLPLLIFGIYAQPEWAFWPAIILMGLYILFKALRSIQTGLSESKFSIVYLFLYLCTIEIIPLAIVIKSAIIFFVE